MNKCALATIVGTLPAGATLDLYFSGYAYKGINLVPLSTIPSLRHLAKLVLAGQVMLKDPVEEARLRRILRNRDFGRSGRHFRIIPNGVDRARFIEVIHAGLEKVCVESPSPLIECAGCLRG